MSDDNNQNDQNAQQQDGGVSTEEALKLKDRNQKLQGQLVDLEKKWNQFSSMYKDVDPDEYRQLKGKLEELEKTAASKDPQKLEELWEKKLQKHRSESESQREKLEVELNQLRQKNKSLAVTDKVMSEINGLFNSDATKFIKREVEELCDLDEDGSIVVKDENGEVFFKGARPLTVKEFGELLVEKYPSLAKASGVGGSKDMTPGQTARNRSSNKTPQSWAELQAMPNAREVLERLKREDPAAVQKILRTISA